MWKGGLYVITGEKLHPGYALLDIMRAALAGGATAIQLRDKEASKRELLAKGEQLQRLAEEFRVPFIMNDHLDVALAIDADGVHFGQGDFPLVEARRLLGSNKIIGISTHTLEEARTAEKEGADYIGVGPVFGTKTKEDIEKPLGVDGVKAICDQISIPTVAIGGIKRDNVQAVKETGVNGVAVISEIVTSMDVTATSKAFAKVFKS